MSIISLAIENFTSYKNLKISDFSSRSNLILGYNGHGKSNFLNGTL